MADNLEIRVEQLTDAIRGLYNKPSLTPAEINNAFNTMLQRFENQTNLTSEKMLQIISNEIRKTAEERQIRLKPQPPKSPTLNLICRYQKLQLI